MEEAIFAGCTEMLCCRGLCHSIKISLVFRHTSAAVEAKKNLLEILNRTKILKEEVKAK